MITLSRKTYAFNIYMYLGKQKIFIQNQIHNFGSKLGKKKTQDYKMFEKMILFQ